MKTYNGLWKILKMQKSYDLDMNFEPDVSSSDEEPLILLNIYSN